MLTESSQTILTLENVQVQEKCFEVLTAKEQGKETQLISYAVVWLTRSKSRNALNTKTLEDLIEAFSFLQTQYHLNVVVLAGKGKSFCAGADLKAGPEPFVPTAREKRYRLQVGRRAIAAIENLEAITIAKVHGHAAGGECGCPSTKRIQTMPWVFVQVGSVWFKHVIYVLYARTLGCGFLK
mmetsp:Transcript_1277/g.1862  ORF Transcript_1277/g.1862 Transcript_1277/m.1862 type:complete len:182 (-) Transcript_1277:2320-2865(-)